MILPNMNGIAIAKEIRNDFIQASAFMTHKQAYFEKKRLKALCYHGYEWQNRKTGNKYLITISSNLMKNPQTRADMSCQVESNRGKVWYRFFDLHEPERGAMAFTPHFYKRYSERCGINKDFPAIIHDFTARNTFYSLIWHNEEQTRAVYAVNTGLILCSNRGDKVVWANTFISRDILKPSQLKAFDAIVGEIDYYDRVIPRTCRSNKLNDMYEFMIASDDFHDKTEFCFQIYNEYFEK